MREKGVLVEVIGGTRPRCWCFETSLDGTREAGEGPAMAASGSGLADVLEQLYGYRYRRFA